MIRAQFVGDRLEIEMVLPTELAEREDLVRAMVAEALETALRQAVEERLHGAG